MSNGIFVNNLNDDSYRNKAVVLGRNERLGMLFVSSEWSHSTLLASANRLSSIVVQIDIERMELTIPKCRYNMTYSEIVNMFAELNINVYSAAASSLKGLASSAIYDILPNEEIAFFKLSGKVPEQWLI